MEPEDGAATVTSQIGPWAMVPVWVLGCGLKPSELAVYISLRSFADQSGAAWPRAKTIADRAQVTVGTARNAIQQMRKLGLLTTAERRRDDGSTAGLHYRLVDIKPAQMEGGTSTDVPPGVQLMYTPTGARCTQEHTTEQTTEHPIASEASSLRSSSSCAKPTTTSAKKRPTKHDVAVADIAARVGVTPDEADAVVRHIAREHAEETGERVRNVAAFVEACSNEDLKAHVAVWRGVRQANAATAADLAVRMNQASGLGTYRAEVERLICQALDDGVTESEIVDHLNARARDIDNKLGPWLSALQDMTSRSTA